MNENNIKLIVLDVDGTLTDGSIIYSSIVGECKVFSVKDGLILKALTRLDIPVIFLTGSNSTLVEKRGKELGVLDVLQGVENKRDVLVSYVSKLGINSKSVAYIGDDLNDYEAMLLCGFKACPSDAVAEIRDICDYVSTYRGGRGAIRDICEYILRLEKKYNEVLDLFGL